MSDFKLVKLLGNPIQINACINPRGAYNNTTVYSIGDLVTYGGLSYIANQAGVGNLPTDTNFWQIVVDISLAGSAWSLAGNTGTDPLVDFLGTIDSNPIKIRTNDNEIAQFDVNGRFGIGPDAPLSSFHLKPYVGYTDSGTRSDSFAMTTSDTNLNTIYSLVLTNGSVAKVTLEVTGRQSDGTERCSFTKSALFYKEGGNIMIQGVTWQSDFTAKSNSLFDVKYTLGVSTVLFKVKAVNATDTYWTGNTKIEILKNNL
jgi:hypothetical protein